MKKPMTMLLLALAGALFNRAWPARSRFPPSRFA